MNGQELKEQGQSRSVAALSAQTWDAFEAILQMYAAGTRISVNDVRMFLDLAQIPDRARGGLFAGAVKSGLLEPVVNEDGDEVRRKSTAISAHRATVRLYVRTGSAAA